MISKNKIDYVLFHLNHHIDISTFRKYFVFCDDLSETHNIQNKIIFLQINKDLQKFNSNKVIWKDSIPVLFPVVEHTLFFYEYNHNIIFPDDLFASAFYLLTGFHEFINQKEDNIGRFPYDYSIQKELDIVKKPIVNYYFDLICKGIQQFCALQGLDCNLRSKFNPFCFFLTHDIDRVSYYHIYETILKIYYFLNIRTSPYNRKTTRKLMLDSLIQTVNIFRRHDPFWNFDFLMEVERKNNFRSTYFFLDKDQLHVDSRYRYSDKKIKKLITKLIAKNHEIGVHGTVRSGLDPISSVHNKMKLEKSAGIQIHGIRQHFLKLRNPETFIIQQNAGFIYDTTYGFAEHEGFRNSYCHPFKPYDFKNDIMLDIWEIPLNAMDGTMFYYRDLTFRQINETIDELLAEITKFNGVFTLLWHNSHFDEYEFPGITKFYCDVLESLHNKKAINLVGTEIIQKYDSIDID